MGDPLSNILGRWGGEKQVFLSESATPDISSNTQLSVSSVAGGFLQISYSWSHKEQPHEGVLLIGQHTGESTVAWVDSWHQKTQIMALSGTSDEEEGVNVSGSYAAPPGPDWGWRIVVQSADSDQLEIRMYNIFPDGKEVLGVLFTCQRTS